MNRKYPFAVRKHYSVRCLTVRAGDWPCARCRHIPRARHPEQVIAADTLNVHIHLVHRRRFLALVLALRCFSLVPVSALQLLRPTLPCGMRARSCSTGNRHRSESWRAQVPRTICQFSTILPRAVTCRGETLGIYVPGSRKGFKSADLSELKAAAGGFADALADVALLRMQSGQCISTDKNNRARKSADPHNNRSELSRFLLQQAIE